MRDLRLPDYLDTRQEADGWWVYSPRDNLVVMGPFPTDDAAREAYADHESMEDPEL